MYGKTVEVLRLGSSICPEENPSCGAPAPFYEGSAFDTTEHVLKIIYKYSTRKFSVYLDGDKKFTSIETDFIPKYIWIGHPMFTNHNDKWTSLHIDYIRVSLLEEEKTNSNSSWHDGVLE